MKKQTFINIIIENFPAEKEFSLDEIQELTKTSRANTKYHLAELVKSGSLEKAGRGKWSLAKKEDNISEMPEPDTENFLKVSLKEREIIEKIFDSPFYKYEKKNRFSLNKLKERLEEEQVALLEGLLKKLQERGIVFKVGKGANGDIVMEVNDERLLKCLSDDYCKTIMISDTELDIKIQKVIKQANLAHQELGELESLLAEKEEEVRITEKEIALLQKKEEQARGEVDNLFKKIEKIQKDFFEGEIIEALEKMPKEKQRDFFKKFLED